MRPAPEEVMLNMARELSRRSTCRRRKVGCVLVDVHGRILSMGHNGVPRGMTHCTDEPCRGSLAPSGTNLDLCEAIHAEQNALMFCPDVMKIHACYVTTCPCIHCLKMLLNTSCLYIHYAAEYTREHTDEAHALWKRSRHPIGGIAQFELKVKP